MPSCSPSLSWCWCSARTGFWANAPPRSISRMSATAISTSPPQQGRTLLTAALAGAALLAYPFLDQSLGLGTVYAVSDAMIYVLLALGLNIVVGYAGLLDLGYAAFFAIGAYTMGLLNSPLMGFEWGFWKVIWLSAVVSAAFGVMIGA